MAKDVSRYPKYSTLPLPRIVGFLDVLCIVAAAYFLITMISWDLSYGLVGSKPLAGQEAAEMAAEIEIPGGWADRIFFNGNAINGNYYSVAEDRSTSYYYVSNGETATLIRQKRNKKRDLKLELPCPGVIINQNLFCLPDENTVYYYAMKADRVLELDYAWRDAVPMLDSWHPDYPYLTGLLNRSEEETLTLYEAAMLAGLIRDNILVGYGDGVAWFLHDHEEDGRLSLVRAEETGWEHHFRFDQAEGVKMVTCNQFFLRLSPEGYVTVTDMAANHTSNIILQKNGVEQPITAFTFLEEDRNWIVQVCGETCAAWYRIDNSELSMVGSDTVPYSDEMMANGPMEYVGVWYGRAHYYCSNIWYEAEMG